MSRARTPDFGLKERGSKYTFQRDEGEIRRRSLALDQRLLFHLARIIAATPTTRRVTRLSRGFHTRSTIQSGISYRGITPRVCTPSSLLVPTFSTDSGSRQKVSRSLIEGLS